MTAFRPAILAAALAAAGFAFAAPASAHDRRGGGDDAAIAIGAGVIGLAVGAAIASDNNDRGYYQGGYYRPYPRYRAYAYPAYPVYRGYPAYRAYPAYRGYDDRYYRQWRGREHWEHRRWDHRGGGRGW